MSLLLGLRRTAPSLALVLLIGVALSSILWIPEYQGERWKATMPDAARASFVNEARRTILQFWGGVVVIIGLYFGWRRIRATDRSNAISAEGQVTERYTRAIEQLGHENEAVRLGGIYALARIAIDSERDNITIRQVLAAYIRKNIKLRLSEAREDVQAALYVLGRGTPSSARISLAECDFSAYDLSHLRFSDCSFTNCNFAETNLEGADLSGADLTNCRFGAANARRVSFRGASIASTVFNKTRLGDASFHKAYISATTLSEVPFGRIGFEFADLAGVRFESCRLTLTSFQHARLRNVEFKTSTGLWQQLLEHALIIDCDLPQVLPDEPTFGSVDTVDTGWESQART